MTDVKLTNKTPKLYVIETPEGERLVAAKSIVAATQHVVKDLVQARVATPMDAARIVGAGGRVEDAAAENDGEQAAA